MARTEIDGTQVQDGTIESQDIKDGDINADDLDISTPGKAVITRVEAIDGLEIVSSTGTDPGTGVVQLRSAAGGFGGDFYSAFDSAESSTTSNGWIVKLVDVTPPVPEGGKFITYFTGELGQSKAAKAVGFLVRCRINTGTWITITDTRTGIATANQYTLRSGFFIVENVQMGDVIEVELSYGQTTDGGTGRIKNAGFISWRISNA